MDRMCVWRQTPNEYNQEVERLAGCLKDIEGVDDRFVDKLIALGVISVLDLDEVGTAPLINELAVDKELAEKIVAATAENAKQQAAQSSQTQAKNVLEQEQQSTDESQ